jgi:hypothetical protein
MIGVSLPPDEPHLPPRGNEGERRRERGREKARRRGWREHFSASAEVKKAEFSIAQYEFSPVCGMQESICILLILFPILTAIFKNSLVSIPDW